MRRPTTNILVDSLALVAMIGLAATGYIVRYVLPPGSGGHGRRIARTLWGYTRHEWGDVHFWLAIGTVTLLAVHVLLHWAWVRSTVRRLLSRDCRQTPSPGVESHPTA